MSADRMGFFQRLILALLLPFRVLFDGRLASRIQRLDVPASDGMLSARVEPRRVQAKPEVEAEENTSVQTAAPEDGAVHLLSLLQRDGRLVDFLLEDVSSYSDRDVGGAARAVHEGCSKTLKQYLQIEPIRAEEEGSTVTVEAGFDATVVRLVGNVTGEPPYSGTLTHPGWRVAGLELPERSGEQSARVLSPAEVEL